MMRAKKDNLANLNDHLINPLLLVVSQLISSLRLKSVYSNYKCKQT